MIVALLMLLVFAAWRGCQNYKTIFHLKLYSSHDYQASPVKKWTQANFLRFGKLQEACLGIFLYAVHGHRPMHTALKLQCNMGVHGGSYRGFQVPKNLWYFCRERISLTSKSTFEGTYNSSVVFIATILGIWSSKKCTGMIKMTFKQHFWNQNKLIFFCWICYIFWEDIEVREYYTIKYLCVSYQIYTSQWREKMTLCIWNK